MDNVDKAIRIDIDKICFCFRVAVGVLISEVYGCGVVIQSSMDPSAIVLCRSARVADFFLSANE